MNEATKLTIRERIIDLESRAIDLERRGVDERVPYGARDPLDAVNDEIEDLREDLALFGEMQFEAEAV